MKPIELVSEWPPDNALECEDLGNLKNIKGFNFEVVRMDRIVAK
jgi:hypothetical protein